MAHPTELDKMGKQTKKMHAHNEKRDGERQVDLQKYSIKLFMQIKLLHILRECQLT